VYSIGEDGDDDGGKEWDRNTMRGLDEDIPFIIERPRK
jgi:hypothetical protein